MYKEKVVITNATGLHARPATMFLQKAKTFKSKTTVTNLSTGKSADAHSMIAVLSLGMTKGTEIEIASDGEDEKQAVTELVALIKSFNE